MSEARPEPETFDQVLEDIYIELRELKDRVATLEASR